MPFKQEGSVRTPEVTPQGPPAPQRPPAPLPGTPSKRPRGPTFVIFQPHPELGQDVVTQGVAELQDLRDWGRGTGSVRASAGSRGAWGRHPGLGSPVDSSGHSEPGSEVAGGSEPRLGLGRAFRAWRSQGCHRQAGGGSTRLGSSPKVRLRSATMFCSPGRTQGGPKATRSGSCKGPPTAPSSHRREPELAGVKGMAVRDRAG